MSWGDDDGPRKPCPWTGCRCTHTAGCEHGWFWAAREDGSEYVLPCPTCRPEVAKQLLKPGAGRRLRAELPKLSRPSRQPNTE